LLLLRAHIPVGFHKILSVRALVGDPPVILAKRTESDSHVQ